MTTATESALTQATDAQLRAEQERRIERAGRKALMQVLKAAVEKLDDSSMTNRTIVHDLESALRVYKDECSDRALKLKARQWQ